MMENNFPKDLTHLIIGLMLNLRTNPGAVLVSCPNDKNCN
jgi:hypothetical protein